MPRDEFTSHDLELYWNDFLSEIQESGNFPLLYSFRTVEWRLNDKKNLELEFNSESIKSEFDEIRENFIGGLRRKLNNYKIDLNLIVNKSKDVNYKLTRLEFYKKLAAQNPALEELRIRLGLDVENEP